MKKLKELGTKARTAYLMLPLLFASESAMAGASFTSMNKSGSDAQTVVAETLKNWKWVFAFLPIGIGIVLMLLIKKYIEEKEEQDGRTEPKMSKWAKMIGGLVGGFVISYIIYGVVAKTLLGKPKFSDGWTIFVTDFWKNVF